MERDKFHNLSITNKFFFTDGGDVEYLAFNVMRKKQREASTNMLGTAELGKTIFAGSYSYVSKLFVLPKVLGLMLWFYLITVCY